MITVNLSKNPTKISNIYIKPVLSKGKYHIVLESQFALYLTDDCIAVRLNMTKYNYVNILMNSYNAYKSNNYTLFCEERDCLNACRWIESIFVMERLVNI
jgi:hypothetical protein